MYPWYRDNQIGVGQFCGPISATIKTETVGYNDCMLAIDYAAQNKVRIHLHAPNYHNHSFFVCKISLKVNSADKIRINLFIQFESRSRQFKAKSMDYSLIDFDQTNCKG